jgi:hypothetical protein
MDLESIRSSLHAAGGGHEAAEEAMEVTQAPYGRILPR